MKTFGLALNLRDDAEKIAEYRRFHQAVWPEVTARLRACGVHRMQIFLRGTRLFMYLITDDAFDPSRDFVRINEDPTSARWNALMAELQERIPGARIGTVDKFQGQEAPVVIYSMTTSSHSDAPRGIEFLYSANRLNVATSRAKCICIVVASPRLFEAECRTPRQMQLANAFCRYLELATPF